MRLIDVISTDANNDIPDFREKSMTMVCPDESEEGAGRGVAFNYAARNKNPMTQRPIEPTAEDINLCVTARLDAVATFLGVSTGTLLNNIEKSAIVARVSKKDLKNIKEKMTPGNWAKTRAKDPNFRADVHNTPVKNKDIFNQTAKRIAQYFSNKKVSPKGLGQAIRKLNWYLVRGGVRIPLEKRERVKEAMTILHLQNLKAKLGK